MNNRAERKKEMDIWHRIGRIVRISNLGTLIFFLLNIGLLLCLFSPYGLTAKNILIITGSYLLSVLLSLSPLGEAVLGALAGAHEIKRNDIKIKLVPLLEIVYGEAKKCTPYMVNSLRLKIVYDEKPNAFAVGRRTICVTEGLLQLNDDEIMAVFAHEIGHIAYGHSLIYLMIGGGNLMIAGGLLLIKLTCWTITALCGLLAIGIKSTLGRMLVILLGVLSSLSIWLWTKFCMLFLCWSMRQNEFAADEYAYRIGFGNTLARVLDQCLCSPPERGLLQALYSTHPHTDERVGRLQNMGAIYSRYYPTVY